MPSFFACVFIENSNVILNMCTLLLHKNTMHLCLQVLQPLFYYLCHFKRNPLMYAI